MSDPALEAYWSAACLALGLDPATPRPEAFAFGDGPALADELIDLVLAGRKRATTGALWEYEQGDEPLPEVGDLAIALDGRGVPRCVLRTEEVRVLPMNEVDADFAFAEGEGDRTLSSWRDAHERFFRRFLPTIGLAFQPDMPVVLERFSVAYPTAAPSDPS